MSRARRRKARTQTGDAEWQRSRDYLVAYNPGDHLLECAEFWACEPGVPDELRADPYRWRDLLAPPKVAAAIRTRGAALLDARAAWLER